MSVYFGLRWSKSLIHMCLSDLFDNMYDLVDSLTFKTHQISPNMWPIFEITYTLFKSDAIDFLDGASFPSVVAITKETAC